MYLTETEMKVGDTLLFCEVYENRNDAGNIELRYTPKEVGVITKTCPKRVYFTPSSEEKRFQKGYADRSSHAGTVLPRSEAERLSFLHLAYYASSGENLERYAIRAANILRERVRRKVRQAAAELKQLMKPVGGIDATVQGAPRSFADRLKADGSKNSRINRFMGDFSFLSNFQACTVTWEGVSYGSVEAAFQAAKCADLTDRAPFRDCLPSEAKRLGRRCKLRPDWEFVKLSIMETLVWRKFQGNSELRQALLETGDAELIEGNRWHDNFWGDCCCPKCSAIQGENRLGAILMNVRSKLRRVQEQTLSLELPDGTIIKARPNDDPAYPGLSICIPHGDGGIDERLCFVELNRDRNNRMFIGAYSADEDDCAYYAPYHPDTNEGDDE